MKTNLSSTPWGPPQVLDFHDPDKTIVRVATADHGGLGVALSRTMPDYLAALGTIQGEYRWFEEDEAFCAVVVAFPRYFPPLWVEGAGLTMQNAYPEVHMRHFGSVLTAADSRALEQREWEAQSRDSFVVLGAFERCWDIPDDCIFVSGFRARDESTAGFLVPRNQYVRPGRLVLDAFRRWEPTRTGPYNPRPPRVARTSDGYTFYEQQDGTWADHLDPASADAVFACLDDLLTQDPDLTVNGAPYASAHPEAPDATIHVAGGDA